MQKLQRLLYFLYNYKFTLLSVVYLYLIINIPVHFTGGILLLFSIVPLVLILYVLAKTKYHLPFSILFALLLAINAYFSFVFKSTINIGFLGSMLETNAQEASEVVGEGLITGLLVLLVSFVLVFGAIGELKKLRFSRKIPLLLLGIYSFIFLPYICHRAVWKSGLEKFLDDNPIYVYHTLVYPHAPILYGNIAVAVAYAHEIYEFNKYKGMERQMPQAVGRDEEARGVKKIYLILGESSTRNNYSLYGYPTRTTPFLDSLNSLPQSPLSYYQGISPAAITRNSVPIILSAATPHNFTFFYKKKTIIDLANQQGYRTVWISSQRKVDAIDSLEGNYAGQIASNSSALYFNESATVDDLHLIDWLQKAYNENEKQFFVLHLAGSHVAYDAKHDELDARAIPGTPSDTLSYNRSIHHTDRVLRQVYKIMQKDASAVMYYVPDHGEVIGTGHGMGKYKAEYEVPLIVIDQSKHSADSLIRSYIEPSTSLINVANTFYILAQLMGYTIDSTAVQHAVNDTKKIMVQDGLVKNFDELK